MIRLVCGVLCVHLELLDFCYSLSQNMELSVYQAEIQ